MACETLVKTGLVIVAGEVTTSAQIDIPKIVRSTICDIGYTPLGHGLRLADLRRHGRHRAAEPDIARGVDDKDNKEQGAGDQGMMFGYACDETPELMPVPIMTRPRADASGWPRCARRATLDFLRPDGKSQVTVEYSSDGRPLRIDAVVVSTQHART